MKKIVLMAKQAIMRRMKKMIKSIHIWNFESHDDSFVEFTPGMNLIMGMSNAGKSAILRALRMIINNDWNKDMVRMGYETCKVRVETDKGWVEAERGEKTNAWRCQKNGCELEEYKKVGIGVPELVTRILGMGERERGAGIKELPNFQSQLEKHYMLSEIGEKKATSNMIAVMMDNAIGLGGMEEMIKDFSSDMAKDKKWLSEKQSEIAELNASILDESLFNDCRRSIEGASSLGNCVNEIDGKMSTAVSAKDAYDSILKQSKRNTCVLEAVNHCDEMESFLSGLKSDSEFIDMMLRMESLTSRLNSLNELSSVSEDKLSCLVEECEHIDAVQKMVNRIVCLEHELRDKSIGLSVDMTLLDNILSSVCAVDRKIFDAENMLSEARIAWKKGRDKEKECSRLYDDMKKASDELDELKNELKICPLCGRGFEK